VNGRRVQENKWLSTTPAFPNSDRPHANRLFRSRRAPRIELTGQNTNQPKREFLENGENAENRVIRNLRNNKTKMQKTRITQRSR